MFFAHETCFLRWVEWTKLLQDGCYGKCSLVNDTAPTYWVHFFIFGPNSWLKSLHVQNNNSGNQQNEMRGSSFCFIRLEGSNWGAWPHLLWKLPSFQIQPLGSFPIQPEPDVCLWGQPMALLVQGMPSQLSPGCQCFVSFWSPTVSQKSKDI